VLNLNDATQIHKHISFYKDNIFRKVFEFDSNENIKFDNKFVEPGFHYTEIPKMEGNVLLVGYCQSEKYFKEYEKEIRELFCFSEEMISTLKEKHKLLLNEETCSMHIRRGDYIGQEQYHNNLNLNYYMKATKQFSKDVKYIIFSDDVDWCRSQFMGEMFLFPEPQDDIDDLCLMSLCNHNIIANSSFSWWGAYLNKNEDKIIVVPKIWLGQTYINSGWDTKDIYCDNWVKM